MPFMRIRFSTFVTKHTWDVSDLHATMNFSISTSNSWMPLRIQKAAVCCCAWNESPCLAHLIRLVEFRCTSPARQASGDARDHLPADALRYPAAEVQFNLSDILCVDLNYLKWKIHKNWKFILLWSSSVFPFAGGLSMFSPRARLWWNHTSRDAPFCNNESEHEDRKIFLSLNNKSLSQTVTETRNNETSPPKYVVQLSLPKFHSCSVTCITGRLAHPCILPSCHTQSGVSAGFSLVRWRKEVQVVRFLDCCRCSSLGSTNFVLFGCGTVGQDPAPLVMFKWSFTRHPIMSVEAPFNLCCNFSTLGIDLSIFGRVEPTSSCVLCPTKVNKTDTCPCTSGPFLLCQVVQTKTIQFINSAAPLEGRKTSASGTNVGCTIPGLSASKKWCHPERMSRLSVENQVVSPNELDVFKPLGHFVFTTPRRPFGKVLSLELFLLTLISGKALVQNWGFSFRHNVLQQQELCLTWRPAPCGYKFRYLCVSCSLIHHQETTSHEVTVHS